MIRNVGFSTQNLSLRKVGFSSIDKQVAEKIPMLLEDGSGTISTTIHENMQKGGYVICRDGKPIFGVSNFCAGPVNKNGNIEYAKYLTEPCHIDHAFAIAKLHELGLQTIFGQGGIEFSRRGCK